MSGLPEDIAEIVRGLDESNRGYGERPLPDPLDEDIARVAIPT